MRAFAILAVIAVIGAIVWYVLGSQQAAEPIATAPVVEAEPEPVEEAEAAIEEPQPETEEQTAVEEVVEDAQAAVEEVAQEAEELAEELQDQANDAIQNAEDRVNNALQDALQGANEAVSGATNSVEGAVANSTDAEAPPSETNVGSLAEALSVEGFDPTVVREAIANADLGAVQTRLAEGLVAQAEENPDLLQSVVDQLRDLLGPS